MSRSGTGPGGPGASTGPTATTGPDRAGPPRPVPLAAAAAVTPLLRWLVITMAVPYGTPPRRDCPHCGTPIGRPGSLRPLTPLATCAGCGRCPGPAPGTVELAVLGAVLLVLAGARPALESLASVWWLALAVPLLFIDIAVHRLPDRLTYPAALGTLGLLGAAALTAGDATPWLRALLAGAGAAAFFAGSALLLGPRSFGLGDAKLALSSVALLGWLGWPWVVSGLMVAFAGSGVTALALLLTRRIRWSAQLPFGPYLILGTVVALVATS